MLGRLPDFAGAGAWCAGDDSWRSRELSRFNASFHGTLSRTVTSVGAGHRIVALGVIHNS